MKKIALLLIVFSLLSIVNLDPAIARGKKKGWKDGMPYGQWKKQYKYNGESNYQYEKDATEALTKALLIPGGGHYYLGDKKGARKFLIAEGIGIALLLAFDDNDSAREMIGTGLDGLKIMSAIDAYKKAKNYSNIRIDLSDNGFKTGVNYNF